MRFLGIFLNSKLQKSFLPQEKIGIIRQTIVSVLHQPRFLIRKAMPLLGLFAASMLAVTRSNSIEVRDSSGLEPFKHRTRQKDLSFKKDLRFLSVLAQLTKSVKGSSLKTKIPQSPDKRHQFSGLRRIPI